MVRGPSLLASGGIELSVVLVELSSEGALEAVSSVGVDVDEESEVGGGLGCDEVTDGAEDTTGVVELVGAPLVGGATGVSGAKLVAEER